MSDYIHIGFDSVYEQEIILTLEQGVVINAEVVTPLRKIWYSDLIDQGDDL